jgi:hypothetical protein
MDLSPDNATNWHVGSLWKPGIWGCYITFNYVGSAYSLILMNSIRNMPSHLRTSNDIFVAGLCFGCLFFSLTCGSQCFANIVHGYFYGGSIACWLEAWFHVSGILTQFICVTLMGIRNYLTVLRKYSITVRQAILAVGVVVTSCFAISFALATVSELYLVMNGTYCFYRFDSPAILMWLVPMLLLATLTVIFCYTRIYLHARLVMRATANLQARATTSSIRIAKRMFLFVVTLVIGWTTMVATAIYEYHYGKNADQALVTAVGVTGTFHTLLVPLVYGYTNIYHRRAIYCCSRVPEGHGRRSSTESSTPAPQRSIILITSHSLKLGHKSEHASSDGSPARCLSSVHQHQQSLCVPPLNLDHATTTPNSSASRPARKHQEQVEITSLNLESLNSA